MRRIQSMLDLRLTGSLNNINGFGVGGWGPLFRTKC